MKRIPLLALIAACAFAQQPAAAPPAAPPAAPERAPGLYAVFNTSMGVITAKLYENETPQTVKNFVGLAKGTKRWKDPKTNTMVARPMYNNITFHRVIPNFMIQTGDPTGTGAHDCGFTIKDEILPTLKFDGPGKLAMANIGSPNTGACQFFITETAYPSLNGGYTLFGQVVSGQELVGKIARTPRDANDKPRTPVKLIRVTIERVGPEPAAPTKNAPAAPAKKAPAKKAPAPVKK